MTEGGFPVATKLRAETIELNEVTDYAMSFLHTKVVELVLGIADRIVGTELAREFHEELVPVVHLQGTLVESDVAEQVGFEPFQDHTFQVGLSEGDFHLVFVEGPQTVLIIQLASVPSKVSGSRTRVHNDNSLAQRELRANRLTAPTRLLRTMRVGSAWGGRSSSLKSSS